MTDIDLMTPLERKRKERNKNVVAEFKELAPKFVAQGYKPYRVLKALAKKHGLTTSGVRFILTQEGCYTTADEYVKQV